MIFTYFFTGIKEKSTILDFDNVLLAIATNIPQRLKNGFVIQGHICMAVNVLTGRNNKKQTHSVCGTGITVMWMSLKSIQHEYYFADKRNLNLNVFFFWNSVH